MQRDGDHIPFVTSGSYPVRGGNAVEPLVDGIPAFRRICQAVESAQHSGWITVAFLHDDFALPDGRGSLFDLLDRTRERGIDVRVIFWRHRELEQFQPGVHFYGTPRQRDRLTDRGSRFWARWDQAHGRYCQHQKSWLVDAGTGHEVAFVGGINLDAGSMVVPGHPPTDQGNTHDVYVEVRGPAVTDVHHNFVQRWNEASDRDEPDGAWPTLATQDDLPFPTLHSPERGDAVVQIQRTIRAGRYRDGTATPGGTTMAIVEGEHSVVDQYLQAIAAAERTIYVEDQAIGSLPIIEALDGSLQRGVDVVFLVPVDANTEMARARSRPESKPFYDALAALGRHDHFALVGIAARRPSGEYQNVYVHAKIALIDDAWCTIGSANIGNRSFYGDTELNASIWHGATVRALRSQLLLEHIAEDTSELDDRAALERYRRVARGNLRARRAGQPLQGLAFALDPATYAS